MIWLAPRHRQPGSKEELLAVVEKAREAGVLGQLCVDAGRTEFHGVPTPTCCSVGPDFPGRTAPITGHPRPLCTGRLGCAPAPASPPGDSTRSPGAWGCSVW